MEKNYGTKNRIILYYIMLLLGLTTFILELFVFEIDDVIGFLITLISIYIMIGSIIKLYKLSSKFIKTIKSIINYFFNIC